MTVGFEAGLYSLLASNAAVAALAGARIYAGYAPQHADYPRITYRIISSLRYVDMLGPRGLAHPRVQLDMWSYSKPNSRDLARAVRETLDGYRGDLADEVAQLIQLIDEFESEEPPSDATEKAIYRVRHDYMLAIEETRPNRL